MNQTVPPTEDQEPGDPEWLRQMRGWEDTPDWLRKVIRLHQPAAGPISGAPGAGADLPHEKEPPAALPDWGDAAALDELALPPAREDDRDWLVAGTSPAAGSLLLPDQEDEEIPEWLQRMSPAADQPPPAPQGARDQRPGDAEIVPLEGAEEQDIPAWLRDLSPPGQAELADDQDVPEWLAELDQMAEADREGDLAQAIGAPSPVQPEGVGAAEELAAEEEPDISDWLLDLAEEPEPDREAELVLPAAVGQEPEVEEEEFPDWLTEMADQALPEGEDLLAELAEEEPTGDWEEALPSLDEILTGEPFAAEEVPAEDQAGAAEWLYEDELEPLSQESIIEFDEGELLATPEWMDELRVRGPERTAADDVVETSGPLTGLRGLLNPDPLLGMTYRSDYVPLPPVPDAQQEEARLLRTSLAAPSKRPEVVPVRARMTGLGRWAIYVALIAVICAGIFAPALQEWIQPAQTMEAQAFFDAVSALPRGSAVLLVVDYDASYDGELTPQARAILWHLMSRDLGVILVSHTPQGVAIVEDLVRDDLAGALGQPYVAGQHYLNLGYMPPHAALLQAFIAQPLGGAALWGVGQAEAAQTPLGQRVVRFEDLDLILVVSSSQEHVRWWVEQTALAGSRAGIVAGASASVAPHLLPYYAAATGAASAASVAAQGRIEGMLIGLAGAAEYEQLTGARFSPSARENLILLGCAQLLLAAIVLAGGIRSVFGRARGT